MNTSAYRKLHPSRRWPTNPKSFDVTAVADTGVQTCTAGTDILADFKDADRWLLPTKHRLRGVDNNGLEIRGTLIVDITSSGGHTTEILYICEKVHGMYLSQTALKHLNVIEPQFPAAPTKISSIIEPQCQPDTIIPSIPGIDTTSSSAAPCGCPTRSPCPPMPEKLPFPATPEYRKNLAN